MCYINLLKLSKHFKWIRKTQCFIFIYQQKWIKDCFKKLRNTLADLWADVHACYCGVDPLQPFTLFYDDGDKVVCRKAPSTHTKSHTQSLLTNWKYNFLVYIYRYSPDSENLCPNMIILWVANILATSSPLQCNWNVSKTLTPNT